jgi:putative ABC transport system substrate-binding protein
MNRRGFITILGGTVLLPPHPARAQEPGRIYHLGSLFSSPRDASFLVALFDELRRLGFVEGQDLTVDPRGFGLRIEQSSDIAAELIKARVDVILVGGDLGIRTVQQATATIPILGVTEDMVGSGLVRSMARPGGNTTGISLLATELNGKRQEMVIEIVPGARRIAVLADANTTASRELQALEDAARARGIELSIHRIAKPEEIIGAMDASQAAGAQGFNVLASPLLFVRRRFILERAAALGLPAIYQWPETAEEGGLAGYGPRIIQLYRDVFARQLVKLLMLLGAAMAVTGPLRAQQKAMPVIGWLDSASAGFRALQMAAYYQGLSETGYAEGKNLAIEYRWAEGHYDRLPTLAADLVGRKVDLIVAAGGPAPAQAARGATSTIPIVFTGVSDPVALGLVASLARPGANLTGFSLLVGEMTPKRLELISELVPEARVIALLVNPNSASAEATIRGMQEAARVKGFQLHVLTATIESEIDAAFASLIQTQAGMLVVGADPFFESRGELLVALAARQAVPAIYAFREFAEAGGLISYGPSVTSVRRQVGVYVGRILKGEKPADLPVQQPTTFELVVNLKTAKALGLTVPPSILARADEVIE